MPKECPQSLVCDELVMSDRAPAFGEQTQLGMEEQMFPYREVHSREGRHMTSMEEGHQHSQWTRMSI